MPKGLTLSLCGDSNDYFGKGLSGGKLAVFAQEKAKFKPEENIIIGNVAFTAQQAGKLISQVWQENGSASAIPVQLLL